MINPYDLMFGNWLRHKDGEEMPVMAMMPRVGETISPGREESVSFHMQINGYPHDEWSPIPITPEWLKRLQLEESIGSVIDIYVDRDRSFSVLIDKKGTIVAGKGAKPVEYVHELQNLYRITFKKSLG